jgi:hypothetical protein
MKIIQFMAIMNIYENDSKNDNNESNGLHAHNVSNENNLLRDFTGAEARRFAGFAQLVAQPPRQVRGGAAPSARALDPFSEDRIAGCQPASHSDSASFIAYGPCAGRSLTGRVSHASAHLSFSKAACRA